jgi:hypothetical protein
VRILIIDEDQPIESVGVVGEAAMTVVGIAGEVADADIVITKSGRLVKDRDGNTEVRVV